jgi:hypothetical protein
MIDFKILNDSVEYYENNGFKRIESPWTVSEYVDNLTKPSDRVSFQLKHNNKCLVASGEQSFLYLYLKEFLPKGQYQTVTPCFRLESFDFSHTKYFMKNELIKSDVVNEIELNKIVDVCFNFFKFYIPNIEIIKTEIGYDIEYKGNELGSYGIRSFDFIEYIYATGCAEPRFSKIINLYKNGIS